MLTGSISAAAKLLYVSQPAVSKLIQYIEGRLVPTAEAQVLFREVERVYQAALEVNECALALAAGGQRKLRISCSASLSTVVIPIALAQLKRESPSLNIEWQTSLMGEMPNQILSKKVDLSIAALPVVHDHLHSQAFMRGRMVVVMPPGHPLAGQPELTLQQLEGHALLLFRPDMPFGKLLAEHIGRCGVQLKSLLSFTNANEAVALVKQGMGIMRDRRVRRAGQRARGGTTGRRDSLRYQLCLFTVRAAVTCSDAFDAGAAGPGAEAWAGDCRLRPLGQTRFLGEQLSCVTCQASSPASQLPQG